MRKKTLKMVVAFHTTAEAMAMEKVCLEKNVPGRLIPLPTSISAGCGLALVCRLKRQETGCGSDGRCWYHGRRYL